MRGEDGISLAAFILTTEDWVFKKPWEHLSAAILDDSVDPFVRAHGKSQFQLNNEDPRVDKLFNAAMSLQRHLPIQVHCLYRLSYLNRIQA